MTTPADRGGTLRTLRGFTLIELIVVVLNLGILAGLAVVGYTQFTAEARDTAARTELRTMGHTLLAEATLNDVEVLDRALVLSALEDAYSGHVYDGIAAATGWTLLAADQQPKHDREVSVGFRSNDTDPYTDNPGTQAKFVVSTGEHTFSEVVYWSTSGEALGPVTEGSDGPGEVTDSPFGSMWLWDNSLTTEQDNRGTGYAAANAATIVQFAREQGLQRVSVSAPWVSDEGPIATWMDETTNALHDAGLEVGVLGGDGGWIEDPTLAAKWAIDAIAARPVDYVELSLEPWNLPTWDTDRSGTVTRWATTIDAVAAVLPTGVTLTLDAPYWLATTPAPAGGTLLDTVLARADLVSIVTFVDHADGTDGIIALSEAARTAAQEAGVPYLVGLETDTPAVAGGAAFTFYDDGSAALASQSAIADAAFSTDRLYRGMAVEHYRAWRTLLGRS